MRHVVHRVRSSISPSCLRVIACLVVIGTAPSYYLCWDHYCMGGHMEHPPYPPSDIVGDWFWILGYLLCIPMFLGSNMTGRFIAAGGLAYLVWVKLANDTAAYDSLCALGGLSALSMFGLLEWRGRAAPATWRRRIAIEMVASVLLVCGWWMARSALTASTPPEWNGVRKGMTLDELHRRFGRPNEARELPASHWVKWNAEGWVDDVRLTVRLDASNRVASMLVGRVLKGTEIVKWEK